VGVVNRKDSMKSRRCGFASLSSDCRILDKSVPLPSGFAVLNGKKEGKRKNA